MAITCSLPVFLDCAGVATTVNIIFQKSIEYVKCIRISTIIPYMCIEILQPNYSLFSQTVHKRVKRRANRTGRRKEFDI